MIWYDMIWYCPTVSSNTAGIAETSPNAEVHSAIRLLHEKGFMLVQIHHQLVEVFAAHCSVKETHVGGKGAKFLIMAKQIFYGK